MDVVWPFPGNIDVAERCTEDPVQRRAEVELDLVVPVGTAEVGDVSGNQ